MGKKVDETLSKFSNSHYYAYASRQKTVESLAEKIETGRYKSWEDLDDLYGATIIIPNLNEEDNVITFLKQTFKKVDMRRRGTNNKPVDVFRFDSTRFIGKLKPVEGDRSNLIYKINFEVQIRTAFEHAWSVSTHPLAYKSEEINWKMLRLSAQIKASVEQLDMLISGAKDISKHIGSNNWPEIEIKIKILEFIKDLFSSNKIPEVVMPKDLSRFTENIFILVKNSIDAWNKKDHIRFDNILEKIRDEIGLYTLENFPRSISLYQFIFGTLIKHKAIEIPNKKFTPFITDELRLIFPEVKVAKNCFKFPKTEDHAYSHL